MTNIRVERILTEVPSFTAEERIQIAEAMLASPAAKPVKIDNVSTSAAVDPESYKRIAAARGEAARIGVEVKTGADGRSRIDILELNLALDKKSREDVTWTPQKRIASKVLLANAGLID